MLRFTQTARLLQSVFQNGSVGGRLLVRGIESCTGPVDGKEGEVSTSVHGSGAVRSGRR